jgi:hypothetical protein
MMKMSATNLATHIKGKSEKEREGRSDDATGSFLLLPIFLILGGGSAVECSILHPDIVVDE